MNDSILYHSIMNLADAFGGKFSGFGIMEDPSRKFLVLLAVLPLLRYLNNRNVRRPLSNPARYLLNLDPVDLIIY